MKHIELYENFGNMGMKPFQNSGRVYATCYDHGDSLVAIGILDRQELLKLKDYLEYANNSQDDLTFLDVTGMGYILHDVMGAFKAMPKSTNPDDYIYFITADGNLSNHYSDSRNDEDRLFEIPREGKLLVYGMHGQTDLVSVNEFAKKYLGI
jgi:hypothetical protein